MSLQGHCKQVKMFPRGKDARGIVHGVPLPYSALNAWGQIKEN